MITTQLPLKNKQQDQSGTAKIKVIFPETEYIQMEWNIHSTSVIVYEETSLL